MDGDKGGATVNKVQHQSGVARLEQDEHKFDTTAADDCEASSCCEAAFCCDAADRRDEDEAGGCEAAGCDDETDPSADEDEDDEDEEDEDADNEDEVIALNGEVSMLC